MNMPFAAVSKRGKYTAEIITIRDAGPIFRTNQGRNRAVAGAAAPLHVGGTWQFGFRDRPRQQELPLAGAETHCGKHVVPATNDV